MSDAPASSHFPLDTIAIFVAIFVFSLIVDLLQHRGRKEVTARDAGVWSIFWVALSLGFYAWLRYRHGSTWGSLFLTGYLLEKTLSVDNLMVFIAIFKFFHIESGLQHRILYFGILGAIVFRFVFVAIGTGFLAVAERLVLVPHVVVDHAGIRRSAGALRDGGALGSGQPGAEVVEAGEDGHGVGAGVVLRRDADAPVADQDAEIATVDQAVAVKVRDGGGGAPDADQGAQVRAVHLAVQVQVTGAGAAGDGPGEHRSAGQRGRGGGEEEETSRSHAELHESSGADSRDAQPHVGAAHPDHAR